MKRHVFFSSLMLGFLTLTVGSAFAEQSISDNGYAVPLTAQAGQALAEQNCQRCHAIGLEGDSTHKQAPPFWQMSWSRSIDTIADMLVTQTGPRHTDMPIFEVTQTQADQLAAWIAWVQPVAHGKRLVEDNCARCHAVGSAGDSTHPEAPPFRILSQFYPIDALQESFAEGIMTGHPDMPVFKMTELQLTDVIAYLDTIQE